MFPPYNSLAEVPEAFREHYVMKGGKAVPEVSSDHPLVVNNATLVTEKSVAETRAVSAETRATKAEGDLAAANVLPRGHVAIPKAEADLLATVKQHGTPEEVAAKLTEYPTLKTKVSTQERRQKFDAIRKVEGWGEESVDVLELIPNLPEVEQRDTDEKDEKGAPKKKNVAKVKQADGSFVEKPFGEYFAATHSALLPSVTAKRQPDGTPVPEHGAGGGSGGADILTERLKTLDAPSPTNPLMPKAATVNA